MSEVVPEKTRSLAEKLSATDAGAKRNGEALENWTRTSSTLFTGVIGLGQELLTFSTKRMNAHVDTWCALANCRRPQDVFECQKRFMETTTTQYSEEINNLTTCFLELIKAASPPSPTKSS
ncbi:MAG TPA: phasin family protein [Methylocella sp.]|nr:phasin family protein [Methylocella sp.]